MANSIVGFHAGSGPGLNGIMDQFVNPVNDAGIPVSIKSANNAGFAAEVIEAGKSRGVDNVVIFRIVGPIPDNPDYNALNAVAEMDSYYDSFIKPRLDAAQELHPHKADVWIELLNEPDKNRWDIVCQWAKRGLQRLNRDGWKGVVIGANAGEPEQNHWTNPFALSLLDYCAANKDIAAISLHEGFTSNDINIPASEMYPHLIGRVSWLNGACDAEGIDRPTVFISELAWAHNDMPLYGKAMTDVAFYANTYNQMPNVKGAFLWNLNAGPEWGDLPKKLNGMFGPMRDFTITTVLPDIDPPTPPPPPEPDCGELPYSVIQHLYPQDLSREEYQEVLDAAFPTRSTVSGSADDVASMVSRGKKPTLIDKAKGIFRAPSGTRAIVWQADRWTDSIGDYLTERGVPQIEYKTFSGETQPPPTQFLWEVPVRAPSNDSNTNFWPGQWGETIGYNQKYTNSATGNEAYHPGHDLNYYPEDFGLEFYAPADGVVTFSRLANVWGKVLVIRHDDPSGSVWTRWAHMKDVYVGEGSVVRKGQPIGTVGTGEGNFGAHLHHDIGGSILQDNPLHWPGLNSQSVLDNYYDATVFYPSKGADIIPLPPTTPPPPPPPPPSGNYSGPPVQYNSYIHGPGSDGMWQNASFKDMMDHLRAKGMKMKYLSNGINFQFAPASGDTHHMVRLFWKPDKKKTPEQAWAEDIRDGALQFYNRGYRNFEVHNEPNLPDEGMGLVWNDGNELGTWLLGLIEVMKQQMPQARYWFPGLSPGVPWTNQFAISEPAWNLSKAAFDGACIHAYSGITHDAEAAAQEIVHQVVEAQKYLWLDTPLFVSEASVNRAAPASYKADVYMRVDQALKTMPGIKGVAWFISHWSGNSHHQENWFGTDLPNLYNPS